MARPVRLEYANATYHVTARGNERRAVFRDDEDRERFTATLAEAVVLHGLVVHGWCPDAQPLSSADRDAEGQPEPGDGLAADHPTRSALTGAGGAAGISSRDGSRRSWWRPTAMRRSCCAMCI